MSCKAINSTNGKRCKNSAKSNGYCHIKSHQNQKIVVENTIHAIDLGFDYKSKNTTTAVDKIHNSLRKGPTKQDEYGSIYIYKIRGDVNSLYRKIGRTKRLPERRLKEWPNSYLIKSWQCNRRRWPRDRFESGSRRPGSAWANSRAEPLPGSSTGRRRRNSPERRGR